MTERIQRPDETGKSKWRAVVLLAFGLVIIGLILAASWASDSRMTALHWIPGWLAAWADRDPNCRTSIPFIPLAFLLAHAFTRLGSKRPLLGASMVSAFCLGLSEFGQIFIPGRTADVMDLLWGGFGILAGMVMAWATGHWRVTPIF